MTILTSPFVFGMPSPFLELQADRGEMERIIREAYQETFGEQEIVDVYVSRFPDEYGAVVLFAHDPPAAAEELALAQEDTFRAQGIRLGILVLKAKTHTASDPE